MATKYQHRIERCDSDWSNAGRAQDKRKAASAAALALGDNAGLSKAETRGIFQEIMNGTMVVERGVYRVSLREV